MSGSEGVNIICVYLNASLNSLSCLFGRRGDQLIPKLGEPEAQPEIALGQIGRPGDQLLP
jgi:hypothetical protein